MADRNHHSSKRRHYTVVLVPNEEASESRSFRFKPWQVRAVVTIGVMIVIALFTALLYWTPLAGWLDIPNPELENQYGREIVALNDRMVTMMEQMLEMRSYNLQLRNALGDRTVSDSLRRASAAVPLERRRTSDVDMMPGRAPSVALSVQAPATRVLASETVPATVAFPASFPTTGYVTRGFEPDRGHLGMDIAGKAGATITAAADGYVIFAGWTQLDGNMVILSHPGGYLTFYKHAQSLTRSAGMFVRRGDPIGTLGDTGETSQGPHVHFEIWKDGSPRDPSLFLMNAAS
ncbi:MAG: M23 family metallopeptidase [Bacteroidetes bacterium]|jgi:murein DD-endopeptidase MepM/ murein hydrolase activator NlpD|nr:M23 family metallopeptidase [Bacteroidota bacterium]